MVNTKDNKYLPMRLNLIKTTVLYAKRFVIALIFHNGLYLSDKHDNLD